MKRYAVFVIACIMAFLVPGVSLCQEETAEGEARDYTDGTVVSVDKAAKTVTIEEYDWANDQKTNAVYYVDPSAETENISSWENIPAGSYVEIEYITEPDGKKVAKYIGLYENE